jgi:hypothetical protein
MTVTLVNISNMNPELMIMSIEKTCAQINVDRILIMSDKPLNLTIPHEQVILPSDFNMWDYCDFCIKHMNSHIHTDHVLITQYDGMATNSDAWTNEFLEYDYVGSISHVNHPPVRNSLQASGFYDQFKNSNWFTCGGGLSLRSKRLLNILAQDDHIQTQNFQPGYNTPLISEDLVITLLNREYLEKAHKIRFAPLELSMRFCAEVVSGYDHAWGFHGWHNAPLYLTEQECLYYFSKLQRPDYHSHGAPMQICKHHVIMRGYMTLRDYLMSTQKWLVY